MERTVKCKPIVKLPRSTVLPDMVKDFPPLPSNPVSLPSNPVSLPSNTVELKDIPLLPSYQMPMPMYPFMPDIPACWSDVTLNVKRACIMRARLMHMRFEDYSY